MIIITHWDLCEFKGKQSKIKHSSYEPTTKEAVEDCENYFVSVALYLSTWNQETPTLKLILLSMFV